MRTWSTASVLSVNDVHLKIKDKVILDNLSAEARSGDILAILGPTGSGKTTFLNVISGRLKPDSGTVQLNGGPFNKRQRRRLAFVQQQDVFFSQLTLWETIYFTAQLRLPESLSESEKREKMDVIIDTLDLRSCLNTLIGDMFSRGLSGGEKKRASIACELLTDPDILLLDEPTSGLDSSTALSLMQQLKSYALHYNKTIITTIHQPSSQIYHMFSNILLLVNGQEAYYGPGNAALSHFEGLGFVCEPHFNPADFLLEIAKSDGATVDKIVSASATNRKEKLNHTANCESADNITPLNGPKSQRSDTESHHHGDVPNSTDIRHTDTSPNGRPANMDNTESHQLVDSLNNTDVHLLVTEEARVDTALIHDKDNDDGKPDHDDSSRRRWQTSWLLQYRMLAWRSFKQTKGVLLQGYTIVQCLVVSCVIGVIYLQSKKDIDTVRDTMGLIFFMGSYWTFQPAMEAISSFPSERPVITKERAAGSYRLSAYYASKITSDIPLGFILPTFMHTLLFWVAGLGGAAQYIQTFLIILLQMLMSQAFGFMLGVTFTELRTALTTMISYAISSFMLGGFVTQSIPPWISWAKYLSCMLYAFNSMSIIIFSPMDPIPCNMTSITTYPQCQQNTTTHITYDDILHKAGIDQPIYCYILPIFGFIVAYRTIGYLVLRFKKQTIL